MWPFIKQLLQLVLSPKRGWEDISAAATAPEVVQRRGFYPWLAVVAVSEFFRLFYVHGLGFLTVVENAIAIVGALFVSLYVGRMVLEMVLPSNIDGRINLDKVFLFVIYMVAIVGLYRFVANVLPTDLTLLHFLPILSVAMIFRSVNFMGIDQDSTVRFVIISSAVVVIIPLVISELLRLII